MGVYLCVFDGDEELEGVEVEAYSDFALFRGAVTELLEAGITGSKYPTLTLHVDSDGEWMPAESEVLKKELDDISARFKQFAAIEFRGQWQPQVARSLGLKPSSLYDCFIDVDGEPLLERLQRLCTVAIKSNRPILFQ